MKSQNPSKELTQARLKELLHYDPETGVFTRKIRASRMDAGSVAGARHVEGYRRIRIDGKDHLSHRLAFLYMVGGFPHDQVDHINGVRDDNRWVNLRESTTSENNQNLGGAKGHNKSGFLGVFWSNYHNRWLARIRVDGRVIYIGCFITPEEGHAAYLKAKDELHPTHRRLRRSPHHVG